MVRVYKEIFRPISNYNSYMTFMPKKIWYNELMYTLLLIIITAITTYHIKDCSNTYYYTYTKKVNSAFGARWWVS